jgi:hypothetical protein
MALNNAVTFFNVVLKTFFFGSALLIENNWQSTRFVRVYNCIGQQRKFGKVI